MADEITIRASLSCVNGSLKVPQFGASSFTADMTGDNYTAGAQDIGITAEAVTIAVEVGTEGWAWFCNSGATNYIELGVQPAATFYPFGKLMPGEYCVIRLGTDAPYARAGATAGSVLQYIILED